MIGKKEWIAVGVYLVAEMLHFPFKSTADSI